MLPTTDADLETPFTAEDYTNAATDDTLFTIQTATSEYSIFLFKDYAGTQANATPTWKGKSNYAPSSSKVSLQIYNYADNQWDDVIENNAVGAGDEFTLTKSIPLEDHYKSANNIISCRVWQLGP